MTVSPMMKHQDDALSMVKANDEAVLAMIKPFVPMLEPFVGMVRMPFGTQFPSTDEVVEQWFDFAMDVLRTQKDFTLKLVNLFVAVEEKPAAVKSAAKAA